jgi:hypothetical protein
VIALSRIAILNEQHLLVTGDPETSLDVIQATADGLQALDIPRLTWAIESVGTGGVLGFLRKHHDYLVVRFGREFPEHLVLIGCSELGSSTMQVSFLVAASERLGRRLQRALLFGDDRRTRDEVGSELGPRAAGVAVRVEAVRTCLGEALNSVAARSESLLGEEE